MATVLSESGREGSAGVGEEVGVAAVAVAVEVGTAAGQLSDMGVALADVLCSIPEVAPAPCRSQGLGGLAITS